MLLTGLLVPTAVQAAETTSASNQMSEGFSTSLILCGFLMVLIFANGLLANVLLQLARAHRDQEQKKQKSNKPSPLTLLNIIFHFLSKGLQRIAFIRWKGPSWKAEPVKVL